ncbi:hypothetical protein [Nocardia sp. NBC_01009]|uniref:hypothetical protein n=1 Tax=Nocardia sp. NBC_01009 TaxID=2975996 RepID=UPI00386D16EB|nr:hypothetical protein OHA42_16505 [Nocardia sp. NBC_01009]
MHTPAVSGADLAWLATDPAVAHATGRYCVGRAERPSSKMSYDLDLRHALYDDSIELLDELTVAASSEHP